MLKIGHPPPCRVHSNISIHNYSSAGGLPQFVIEGSPDAVVVSFNAGATDTNWVGGDGATSAELLGPQLETPAADFLDPVTVRGLSACDRYQLAASAATSSTCSSMAAANQPLDCTLDEADAWIPSQAYVEGLRIGKTTT